MFDRDEQEFSLIIEESLEAILTGKASLGDVLRQHPEIAAQLQPELETALWLLARQEQVEPRPGFVKLSRGRIVDRVRHESLRRGTRRGFLGFPWPQQRYIFPWAAALIFLLILFASTSGIISISQGALPDQQLYSVKRVSEEVAFGLALSDVRKVDLRAEYTGRRLSEIEKLITDGNYVTAAETLSEFEQEVNQSVVLLQEVSDMQSEEKGDLANQIQEDFSEFAKRLDALAPNAPEEVRASLERARDVSMNGASLAIEVYEDIQEKKNHATVTPFEEIVTPVPSVIEVIETARPRDDAPPPTPDFVPTATDTEDSKNPKSLKTPKPTNIHRPDKTDDPTEILVPTTADLPVDDLIPTIEEKPTKEEKDKDKDDK